MLAGIPEKFGNHGMIWPVELSAKQKDKDFMHSRRKWLVGCAAHALKFAHDEFGKVFFPSIPSIHHWNQSRVALSGVALYHADDIEVLKCLLKGQFMQSVLLRAYECTNEFLA